MADTSDFRNGMILDINGEYWTIVEFQHVKPGKGGAFVRTKIKNLITGQVKENTFRAGERVNEVRVERRLYQYLYSSGGMYYMMDKNTYDQIPLDESMMKEAKGYLKENMDIGIYMDGETPLLVELPHFVELTVRQTEPGIRGDTAQGGTKPATMETGLVVHVPLFIDIGDVIRIDTRTGKYLARV
ncbi:MAG: elongation factor P [Candidatus Latescibacterota bacterium]|nr:MAG: elongation factor P [Candidatus Latescibacterota bacterium]